MGNAISTITSKWQVTIPEDVRKGISLKIGQRIVWKVEDDKLVGRRIQTISELAGCLKSSAGTPEAKKTRGGFSKAAIARHDRISKQGS